MIIEKITEGSDFYLKYMERADYNFVGANCWYQAVSCGLEYQNCIFHSLEYVNFLFLYNQQTSIDYIFDKVPQEYISSDGTEFVDTPISIYNTDYLQYINELYGKSQATKFIKECDKNALDMDLISNIDFDKKSLIIPVYTLDLKKDYDILNKSHRIIDHGEYHFINIFGIKNGYVYFFDKYFRAKGVLSLDTLNKANKTATELHPNSKLFIFEKMNISETKSKIIELLISNLKLYFNTEKIIVNKNIYNTNIKALEYFIHDIPYILNELDNKYKNYSPLFFSYPYYSHVQQRKSMWILFEYLDEILNITILKQIKANLKESFDLTLGLNLFADKVLLQKSNLSGKTSSIKNILMRTMIIDKEIDCLFENLLDCLYVMI